MNVMNPLDMKLSRGFNTYHHHHLLKVAFYFFVFIFVTDDNFETCRIAYLLLFPTLNCIAQKHFTVYVLNDALLSIKINQSKKSCNESND